MKTENFTHEDVMKIAKFAKEKGIKFSFYNKPSPVSMPMVGSSSVVIYNNFSPTKMFNEILSVCKDKGYNYYQDNFNELESLINS